MDCKSIRFDSHGTRCAAWFFECNLPGKRPCVVLAHGLAGIKEMRLDAYAERFAAAGYHALVFDYRHFGESEGAPRQLLDITKQHQDWHSAIKSARSQPNVDPEQIVLWGSSLSGGHVIAVADQDCSVAAVISQVPHMLGLTSGLAGGLVSATRLTLHAIVDVFAGLIRRSPHYVNACGKPGELALMTATGAVEGYFQLLPKGKSFDQRVAARFVLSAVTYSPGRKLRALSMPILVQVGSKDTTTPASGALKSCRGAKTATLKTYDTGHFEPYVDPLFETIIGDQLTFLHDVLKKRTPLKEKCATQRRSIFITGAAKGIGAEIARLFSSNGWIVGITDINHIDLDALRSKLGDEHFYRQLDVTAFEQVESALAEFAAVNGGAIDVLINNAGIAFIDDFEKLSLQKHLAVTEVNVKGVQIVSYHALPFLKKSIHAVLVNMCSLSSEYGVPSEASYSASKFWVKGFTEALNIEWERHGIYVCDVMPNFVATPMMDAAHGPIVDAIGIHLTPADVAKTVWRAVQRQRKVHWAVDTWRPILMRSISKLLPTTLRRAIMKRVSGY